MDGKSRLGPGTGWPSRDPAVSGERPEGRPVSQRPSWGRIGTPLGSHLLGQTQGGPPDPSLPPATPWTHTRLLTAAADGPGGLGNEGSGSWAAL